MSHPPSRWWRYVLVGGAGLLALYALVGYVLLPLAAPGFVVDAIEDALHAEASLEDVDFDPFRFHATAKELRITSPDGEPMLRVGRFAANFDPLDSLVAGAITLSEVDLSGVRLDLRIDESERINWLEALKADPDEGAEEASDEEEGGPPDLLLRAFTLRDSTAAFRDESFRTPLELEVTPIDVSVSSLRLGGGTLGDGAPLEIALGLSSGGSLALEGDVDLDPPVAHIDVRGEGLALEKLSPVIENVSGARLARGLFSMTGRFDYDETQARPFGFTGGLELEALDLRDAATDVTVIAAGVVAVEGVEATGRPLDARIARVRLVAPMVRMDVDPGGSLNLTRIAQAPPARARDAADEEAPALEVEITTEGGPQDAGDLSDRIRIDEILMSDGRLDVADRSLDPAVELGLTGMSLTLRNVDSEGTTPITLSFEASTDTRARLDVAGELQPFDAPRSADLRLTLRNLGLVNFSPYSSRYAGHPIERGSANLELAYVLRDVLLKGDNRILLDALDLGPRTDSPDAPKVPVKLGLELLKDKNGQVALDVPIEGEIDDPDFSLFRLFRQVLLTQLVKVTSQPLRFMGMMVPGNGSPDRIAFPPGGVGLGAAESRQLREVAALLGERDKLVVRLVPSASRDGDAHAIAREQLERELVAVHQDRWWRRSKDEDLVLTTEEREDALRRLHRRLADAGKIPPAVAAGDDPAARLAQMEADVVATIEVPDEALEALARQRAGIAREALLATGLVEADRIDDAAPEIVDESPKGGSGVRLVLDAR